MITDEQVKAAADVIEGIGEDDIGTDQDNAAIETLLAWVRQELSRRTSPDDGPITAEWCEANGGRIDDDAYVWQFVEAGEVVTVTWMNGRCVWIEDYDDRDDIGLPHIKTRSQLLALLTALCGELSENPRQLEPLSPTEQLHLRGQQNNI